MMVSHTAAEVIFHEKIRPNCIQDKNYCQNIDTEFLLDRNKSQHYIAIKLSYVPQPYSKTANIYIIVQIVV